MSDDEWTDEDYYEWIEKKEAFDAGEYELDDDEGFRCANCEWADMTAPMNMEASSDEIAYGDEPVTVCPECGAEAVLAKNL